MEKGRNWMKLNPEFRQRLLGRSRYLVYDFRMSNGKYVLYRYFKKHRVHVWYPYDNVVYFSDDYRHCVVYPIEVRKNEEREARRALEEMYQQSVLLSPGEEYRRMLEEYV